MEIDLNELERLANAAHKYNNFWFEKDDFEDLNIGSDDAALIARMSHDVVLELVRRLRTAEILSAEVERLRAAICATLDANGHLADGEVCTLLALKVALRESGAPWAGDELHNP